MNVSIRRADCLPTCQLVAIGAGIIHSKQVFHCLVPSFKLQFLTTKCLWTKNNQMETSFNIGMWREGEDSDSVCLQGFSCSPMKLYKATYKMGKKSVNTVYTNFSGFPKFLEVPAHVGELIAQ